MKMEHHFENKSFEVPLIHDNINQIEYKIGTSKPIICMMIRGGEDLKTDYITWDKNQAKVLKESRNVVQELNIDKYNSWNKMVRVQARLTSMAEGPRTKIPRPIPKRAMGWLRDLSAEVLTNAKWSIIKQEQRLGFKDTLRKGSLELGWPKKSELAKVGACFDSEGILRANARLDGIQGIPLAEKRPVILPKGSRIAMLIADYYHQELGHNSSVAQLMSLMREIFWVIGLRSLAKKVVKKCISCKKARGKPMQPHMAKLPKDMVQYSDLSIFETVSMDYAGPFDVKVNRTTQKHYPIAAYEDKVVSIEMDKYPEYWDKLS
jgi:hypothetical protein